MIKNLISQKQAIKLMVALLIVVLVFHMLILSGTIPYAIVWAGKISTVKDMRKVEVISVCVNSFSIMILLFKGNYIHNKVSKKLLNAMIWFLVVLFSFNTVGNLFATSKFELFFFTPLTFISSILCLQIVSEKRLKEPTVHKL